MTNNECWKKLINAIIKQAAVDYDEALQGHTVDDIPPIIMKEECETFLKYVGGNYIIRKVREHAKEEINKNTEILNCKYCGEKGQLIRVADVADDLPLYIVACINPKCSKRSATAVKKTKEEAVRYWRKMMGDI